MILQPGQSLAVSGANESGVTITYSGTVISSGGSPVGIINNQLANVIGSRTVLTAGTNAIRIDSFNVSATSQEVISVELITGSLVEYLASGVIDQWNDLSLESDSWVFSYGPMPIESSSQSVTIASTMYVESGSKLSNKRIKLAKSANQNMLRNTAWGGVGRTISSITNASVSIGGTLAVVATVTLANHGKSAGDYVYIGGVTPNDYNGIWEVYDTPTSGTLRYIMAYDVGDAISAGSGVQLPYIQTVNTYTTNSVTATAASTAVTGAGFIVGAEWVGKSIGAVVNGVFTILGTIASVATTAAMTLSAGSAATVAGARWTILDPAVMEMYDADYDITIDNCYFDYDGLNQTTSDTFQSHGIYLRRVKKLSINNVDVRNVKKYAFCLANCYDVTINGVYLDTLSDGIHFQGSGANITVENVSGLAGDDFVVLGQSDLFQYLDSSTAFGEFENVTIRNLKPRMALSAFKYYGCANASLVDIDLSDIGGKISGGPCTINFLNDSSCVGSEAGNLGGVSLVKRAKMDISVDQASTKPAIAINGTTFNHLSIPEMMVGLGNTAGTSNGVYMTNGSRVNNLSGGTWHFYSSDGTFHSNAVGWYMDGSSMVLRATIGSILGYFISRIINNNCTVPTTDNTCIWTVGALGCETVDYGCLSAGRITLEYGYVRKRGQSGSATFWTFNDHGILRVAKASNLENSNSLLVAATKNLLVYAPDVGIDTSVLAGAVVGQRDSSFFNVAAALGTLQQYNTVFWRPSDSKWVQVTNTTLTS